MKNVRLVLLAAAAASTAMTCDRAVADEPLERELAACAAIDSPEERLACFDALSLRVRTGDGEQGVAQRDSSAPPLAAPAAGTAVRPLGDDVGKPAGDDEQAAEAYAATLLRCEVQGPGDSTYFYFENGQVWRQSKSRKLRLRDCDGEVRISRDFFGFKLYMPDEDRTIRVRRVR